MKKKGSSKWIDGERKGEGTEEKKDEKNKKAAIKIVSTIEGDHTTYKDEET